METIDLAAGLRGLLSPLVRRLRQERGHQLPSPLVSALGVIRHAGVITMGDLAAREHLSRPAVSRSVADLAARGLVVRRPDEVDRRIVWVSLSDAGRELLELTAARNDLWLAERIAQLDDEEREHLERALPVLQRIADVSSPARTPNGRIDHAHR